jgi:hypothetical protein
MANKRKLKGNWITEYAEAQAPHTEAPSQFCIWSAISVVGAVLKKNVWRKRGPYTIYPNQYIVLTAPPGIGKGESVHPVYNIARDLKLINMMSDRITAPKILERLAAGFAPTGPIPVNGNGHIVLSKDSSATLFSMELQTLLTSSDWMLPFLCECWDRGEYEYDTKTAGSSFVKGMCTSLIGACVPEYIRKLNRDAVAAVNGGFTARSIFVYAEAKSKSLPWPSALEDSPKGRQLISDLRDDLLAIASLQGEMQMEESAKLEFTRFYSGINIGDMDSDVLMHFKRRIHIHVLKLSMVFSAAESDSLIITKGNMLNAILCLRHVQQNLDKAFRGVGESELAEATSKIQTFIERKGITSRSEILRSMHRHVTPENLDRILSLLAQTEFFEYFMGGNKQLIKHTNKASKTVVQTSTANF